MGKLGVLGLLCVALVGCGNRQTAAVVVPDGLGPIYSLSFRNATVADTLLTADTGERTTLLAQQWSDGKVLFKISPTSFTDGTIASRPLYRCLNEQTHFFSNDPACEGETADTLLGYVASEATLKMPYPVRRCFWKGDSSGYYFAIVSAACPVGSQDQGVFGYAQKPDDAVAGVASSPELVPPVSSLVSLYRLHNLSTGDYLISDNPGEGDELGYQNEGVVFTVLSTPVSQDMSPLYRCVIPGRMTHFTSLRADCEGQQSEGHYGWIYNSRGPSHSDAEQIYRFVDPGDPSIHLTTSLREGVASGYVFDGTQGYTYSSTSANLTSPALTYFAYAAGQEAKAIDNYALHTYAYAPTIMKADDGTYYMWSCSGVSGVGDTVVFTSSRDGIHWAPYQIALHSFNNLDYDRDGIGVFACDPSVVKSPPVNGISYYYLFFSTVQKGQGTVNALARSLTPAGPFAVFTGGDPTNDANWSTTVDSNHLPYIITQPVAPCPDCYGAGQPTVVVKDGQFLMWYTDTTATPDGIYFSTSSDGVQWTKGVSTGVHNASVDVKYDPVTQQFVMVGLLPNHHVDVALQVNVSPDGVQWTTATVDQGTSIPPFSNNVGVAGDPSGFLLKDVSLVGFGAPYSLHDYNYNNDCTQAINNDINNDECWAHWNLWVAPFFIGRY